jgi:uncharacterized protein (UPF0147 family)
MLDEEGLLDEMSALDEIRIVENVSTDDDNPAIDEMIMFEVLSNCEER